MLVIHFKHDMYLFQASFCIFLKKYTSFLQHNYFNRKS